MGVDYSLPPHEQVPGTLADSSNVVINAKGLVEGRKGQVKLNSTSLASRVTSFFEHRDGVSTRDKLVSYSTKIGEYNSGTGDFVDRITGLTSNKMTQWINFGGKAICVNEGADAPQYFTDSSTNGDLAGSPPDGRTIADWSNRVWLGGDASNVGTLTGSKLNDETDWSDATASTGYVSEVIGDGNDPITGIFGFFDWLLVGKRNNLYRVSGAPATDSDTLRIDPLYSKAGDNIGFTSPWAITQVGNDVIFMDGMDIKSLTGIQEKGDVETTSIIPHFRDFLADTADADYIQYTHFFHYKTAKQIWISVPTGASTHYLFVLDYQFKDSTGRYSFFPMGGIVPNCFGGVENGEVEDMYYGDETGYVRQLATGNNDDGSAISQFFTQTISGNNPDKGVLTAHEWRKQFTAIEAFFTSEQAALAMTPSYAIDLMDDAQVRTSGNYTSLGAETVTGWAGTGVYSKRLRPFGVSGRTFSLKWAHAAVNQNFVCYPSSVGYKVKSKTQVV